MLIIQLSPGRSFYTGSTHNRDGVVKSGEPASRLSRRNGLCVNRRSFRHRNGDGCRFGAAPAPASFRQRPSLMQFYSGATGLPGRFTEGFLLRRLHVAVPCERRQSVRREPCPVAGGQAPYGAPDLETTYPRSHPASSRCGRSRLLNP